MSITKLLFKDDSKKKVKEAEQELDKAGQALKDAKAVFKQETDKALDTVEQPLKEKELAEQTIEQAQAELSETTDFQEIADLLETVERNKKVIKIYEVQYNNARKQEHKAVMQAFVELIQAQDGLKSAIKAFKQNIEPFINEDNKDDLNGIISDYEGLFYDSRKVGNRLDRLNMLQDDSLGVSRFKSIILPNGRKVAFKHL